MRTIFAFFAFLSSTFLICIAQATAETPTRETEIERHHVLAAHIITYQPRSVGIAEFLKALGADYRNPFWTELREISKSVTAWPEITQENGALIIGTGAERTTLKLTDVSSGRLKVNGRSYQIDGKKSYFKQAKRVLADERNAASHWRLLLPESFATVNDPASAKTVVIPVVVGGLVGLIHGFGAAVGGGAALTVGGVGAVAGAAVGGIGCSVVQYWGHGETFWQRYLNCLAAPLSLVGLNPLDQLRVKKMETCTPNKVVVHVESASGRMQIREFQFAPPTLKSVRLLEPKSSEGTHELFLQADPTGRFFSIGKSKKPRITAELNSTSLKQTRSLIRDATFYQALCATPERLKLVNEKILSDSAVSDVEPSDIHEKTVK